MLFFADSIAVYVHNVAIKPDVTSRKDTFIMLTVLAICYSRQYFIISRMLFAMLFNNAKQEWLFCFNATFIMPEPLQRPSGDLKTNDCTSCLEHVST
jgi:hypothetical protein